MFCLKEAAGHQEDSANPHTRTNVISFPESSAQETKAAKHSFRAIRATELNPISTTTK